MSAVEDDGHRGGSSGSKFSGTVFWTTYNSQIIALVAVVISSISLLQSCEQNSLGKRIPFQTALYETRVSALQSYASAHYDLDNSFRLTLNDMPYDIYSPQNLEMTSDRRMQENAVVARRFIKEYESYFTEAQSTKSLWPKEVQDKIVEAANTATDAAQCFIMVGQKTLKDGTYTPEDYRITYGDVRLMASSPCNGLTDRVVITKFQNSGRIALEAMENNLRQTQGDLVPK